MKRGWLLLALGLTAYLAFMIVTLPAAALIARLEPLGIRAVSTAGTVWQGEAFGLRSADTALGDLSWELHPAQLLLGRAAARFALERPDGHARGEIEVRLGGRITLRTTNVSLPLALLAEMGAPRGWSGTVNAALDHLVLEDGWIEDAAGLIEARDLYGPARDPLSMGSFRVIVPAPADVAAQDALVGALEDLADGPLEVIGTIRLSPDETYLIEGLVAPRPGAPQPVIDSLRFLGPPDAGGRRPFSIAGEL